MRPKFINGSLLMQPSALIPLLMSLTALSLVIIHAAIYGIAHEADEGTLAHIFQILMVAQLPVVVYFAIKWLQKNPKQSLLVLALQAATWLAAIAAVLWFT